MIEKDLRYSQTHEWARVEEDGTVSVGLSGYAIEQLGDVVYMELPSVGDVLTGGEAFGVVESVKAASDMCAPVTGKVTAVNDTIQGDPDVLKRDTYGAGWLIRIEVAGLDEYEALLDSDEYEKFIESEQE
jgi:glycine cleavage system H protein